MFIVNKRNYCDEIVSCQASVSVSLVLYSHLLHFVATVLLLFSTWVAHYICSNIKCVTYQNKLFHLQVLILHCGSCGCLCCGHQIGLIYFIQYFQLVFLWNAFGRPTAVFHGRFT